MRRLRWLLPVAILAILTGVGAVYLKRLREQNAHSPKRPDLLDTGTQGQALDWCYDQSMGANPKVSICASKMTRVGDKTQLEHVQLKIFSEQGDSYDLVTSERADFDITQRTMYSDGDVEITLNIPAQKDGEPPPPMPGRLLKIHSSGVQFSSETGEASTTRAVSFEFDRGSGTSVGAHYNPANRELEMSSEVKLDWRGKTPNAPPMHVESGQAWYLENQDKVLLTPWAKLTRGTLHMESQWTEVLLKEGEIEQVDAQVGHGTQETPGRKVEFGAKDLHMFFDDQMTIKYILAAPQARLVSTAQATRTTVTGDHIDLNFTPVNKESVLTHAVAGGKGNVTAEPVQRASATAPETRVLQSEVIHLFMREGGQDIDRVETEGAGTLDFLPNRPDQLKRNLNGDRIWIYYAAGNRIDRFRSVNVKTRTESKPPRLTESKELQAQFDAAGTMTHMDQNGDFRFEEGARRASSLKAAYEQPKNLLTLDGKASTSDDSGKVTADRITLHEITGDYTADGNVSTTRQPSRKGGSSAMLSNSEVMQATAKRMTSTNHNQRIHYDGDARAWQGANRVTASVIDIDQDHQVMEAHGKVETQFADKEAKQGPPAFTVVRSSDLVYNSDTQIAHYTGGVHLDRPSLTDDSKELRAFLKKEEEDTSLDHAFADGTVKIESTTVTGRSKRIRVGTSEHAEYYPDEQKVILNGGRPKLVDSGAGTTEGEELTWWANNDRLLVNGKESRPVQTVIPKNRTK